MGSVKIKHMYRFMIFFITIIAFTSGCQPQSGRGFSEQEIGEDEVIEKMSVFWTNDNGIDETIRIDFLNGKKTILLFDEDENEIVENWDVPKEFKEFLREEVLTELNDYEKESTIEGERRILWRVEIQGEKNRIAQNGFEMYPEFWEQLLEYIL